MRGAVKSRPTAAGPADVLDPYFARAFDPAIGCRIVRGHLPHRIARLIETGWTHRAEDVWRLVERGAGSAAEARESGRQWISPAQRREPPEITVRRAQRETVLDGKGRQMRIRD